MKAIFYCPQEHSHWLMRYFPRLSPYMLKICNKPLLEYYLDFCVLIGVKEIRVLINDPNMELEETFNTGVKWGLDISYSLSKPDDNVPQILSKNSNFADGNDLLLFYGYGFLSYDKEKQYSLFEKKSSFRIGQDDMSLHYITANTNPEELAQISEVMPEELSFLKLDSISTYWKLSMDVLNSRIGSFILPGYNSEPGVYLGKNLSYPRGTTLNKPLMLGDKVSLQESILIGPDVVVGDNVIIDSSSTVKGAIIYDKTYVGSDLEIINKIVNGNRLIDPESGEFINLVDEFFLTNYKPGISRSFLLRSFHSIVSLLLLFIFFVPFVFIKFLTILGGVEKKKQNCLVSVNEKTRFYNLYLPKMKNPIGNLFYRFSLDKYHFYLECFLGKLWLVGNRILPSNAKGIDILYTLPDYKPAVFSLSEKLDCDHNDPEYIIHEIYYLNNSNLIEDFKILLKFLWQRFWK